MDWRDSGFMLSARRHGESALVVELLTREHGRHAGLVRDGQSPRRRALFQPGNLLVANWRGRLAEHLGSFECELVRAHAAQFIDDPDRLAALASATTLLVSAVPEREPHADIYDALTALIGALDSGADWPRFYVVWERDLLSALGFGLDLGRCALTGATADLAFVSPRTGRAVSRAAAAPYHDKLLPLPDFLWRPAFATTADVMAGLALTGHFLDRHLLLPQGRGLPEARRRFAERMRRAALAASIGS